MIDFADDENIPILERLELPLLVMALRMAQEAKKENWHWLQMSEWLFSDDEVEISIALEHLEVELQSRDSKQIRDHYVSFGKAMQQAQTALMDRIEALTSTESAGDENGR